MKTATKSLVWRFAIIIAIVGAWSIEFSRKELKFGLDLEGGSEFIINFNEEEIPEGSTKDEIIDQIQQIMTARIDQSGIKEPELKKVGPTSLSLKMAGSTAEDKAEIRKLIKQTAKLTFHGVSDENQKLVGEYSALLLEKKGNQASAIAAFNPPPGFKLAFVKADENATERPIIIRSRPEMLDGKSLDRAMATIDQWGQNEVTLRFNNSGAVAFGKVSAEYIGKQLAIVLDGKVYSAPNINEAIYGGSARISGSFSAKEARQLAVVLSCGNLPVAIEIGSEFDTAPTLGAASVASGKAAAVWGLVAVFVFMIVYYLIAGVISSVALGVNILLILGTMAIMGGTLTLPGIAGIVLTIGMAVDANVIIFERIREELIKGKSIANAIHAGFDRAFVTILDANVTTLLTAYILYKFGTGSVKGFAVTLSIGIVASMFTALFMTRAIFDLLLRLNLLKGLTMLQAIKNPNINFLSKRKVAAVFSAVMIVASLLIVFTKGNDALSVDFTGGSEITFKGTDVDVSSEVVQIALNKAGFAKAKANFKFAAGQDGKWLAVSTPMTTNDPALDITKMQTIISSTITKGQFTHENTNSIGSQVGSGFRDDALFAMFLSVIGIIIYISFRFEFKYAIAANIALVHDVVIALGIFLLLGRQISLPVVAAMLTIIGYSLNDTIVVFDRIREDVGLIKDKSLVEIINLSLNQTLSRTILTSLTTLLVVVTLFLFGGSGVNDFALLMMIGIFIGTYSSIFVASAVVAVWQDKEEETPVIPVIEEA